MLEYTEYNLSNLKEIHFNGKTGKCIIDIRQGWTKEQILEEIAIQEVVMGRRPEKFIYKEGD